MTCEERDADLLLLTHNALSPGSRLSTMMHLQRCPGCRERLERLQQVSALVAERLRDPEAVVLPAPPQTASRHLLAAMAAFLLLCLLLTGVRAIMLRSATSPSRIAPTRTSPTDGCLPGLASDRCR